MKFKLRKVKIMYIVTIIVTINLILLFFKQQSTMSRINKEINIAHEELQKTKEKNIKLLHEVKMSNTEKYKERLARERLGLIKKGEVPVVNGNTK